MRCLFPRSEIVLEYEGASVIRLPLARRWLALHESCLFGRVCDALWNTSKEVGRELEGRCSVLQKLELAEEDIAWGRDLHGHAEPPLHSIDVLRCRDTECLFRLRMHRTLFPAFAVVAEATL